MRLFPFTTAGHKNDKPAPSSDQGLEYGPQHDRPGQSENHKQTMARISIWDSYGAQANRALPKIAQGPLAPKTFLFKIALHRHFPKLSCLTVLSSTDEKKKWYKCNLDNISVMIIFHLVICDGNYEAQHDFHWFIIRFPMLYFPRQAFKGCCFWTPGQPFMASTPHNCQSYLYFSLYALTWRTFLSLLSSLILF